MDEDAQGIVPTGGATGQVVDHQLDVVGVRDADADHIGSGSHLGTRRCGGRPGVDHRLDRRRVQVEHDDRHGGIEQAPDHGRTHLSQAHIPDAHAAFPGVNRIGNFAQPVTFELWNRTLASWSTS